MSKTKIAVTERPKARHLNPANRNRVIRPKKGGGYRRRARSNQEKE